MVFIVSDYHGQYAFNEYLNKKRRNDHIYSDENKGTLYTKSKLKELKELFTKYYMKWRIYVIVLHRMQKNNNKKQHTDPMMEINSREQQKIARHNQLLIHTEFKRTKPKLKDKKHYVNKQMNNTK